MIFGSFSCPPGEHYVKRHLGSEVLIFIISFAALVSCSHTSSAAHHESVEDHSDSSNRKYIYCVQEDKEKGIKTVIDY